MLSDIVKMVHDIFVGYSLSKSITHTNLVLISKKLNVQSFLDMRLISLSNFIYKILSKIIHDRLEKLLPKLISTNQFVFVKERSNTKNVLLAQKLITDIRERGKPSNIIIKIDFPKAYDGVSLFFLMKVLRKMGFSNNVIDMVWRLISNNYYSILIND